MIMSLSTRAAVDRLPNGFRPFAALPPADGATRGSGCESGRDYGIMGFQSTRSSEPEGASPGSLPIQTQ